MALDLVNSGESGTTICRVLPHWTSPNEVQKQPPPGAVALRACGWSPLRPFSSSSSGFRFSPSWQEPVPSADVISPPDNQKEVNRWTRNRKNGLFFWCDLLKALIYDEIDREATNRFLKELGRKAGLFPRRTDREALAFHLSAQI